MAHFLLIDESIKNNLPPIKENEMPKIGMEPVRKKALVDAALRTIGHHGSLNVTMSDIAREAGVSAALAHHYFGSKQQLLLETIRSLLRDLRRDAVAALTRASGPRERLSAIIHVSFQSDQFSPEAVAAWLAFYVDSQRSEETRRLLVLYARRLRSNLLSSLNRLCPPDDAARIAEGAAALIDGLYIRHSLRAAPPAFSSAPALVEDYFDVQLKPFLEGRRSKPPVHLL
jgi:TetR/AcrR family transcriptional regulator, transcriptional repressor of bet genes